MSMSPYGNMLFFESERSRLIYLFYEKINILVGLSMTIFRFLIAKARYLRYVSHIWDSSGFLPSLSRGKNSPAGIPAAASSAFAEQQVSRHPWFPQ